MSQSDNRLLQAFLTFLILNTNLRVPPNANTVEHSAIGKKEASHRVLITRSGH